MDVEPGLVTLAPEEGARRLALTLLARGDEAAGRLAAGDDPEALHDLRVTVRRLRTLLRAGRAWLRGGVRAKDERRLRRLARRTSAARDAEVQHALLAGLGAPLGDGARERVEALLGAGAPGDVDPGPAAFVARWRRDRARLGRRLAKLVAAEDAPLRTLGAALAPVLMAELAALDRRLGRVRGGRDAERVHAARIAGKRLRYLLEPLRADARPAAARAVKRLGALQDVMGALHDHHVLLGRLDAALAGRPGRRGAEALRTARRLARAERDALGERLLAARDAGAVEALAADVAEAAASAARGRRGDPEAPVDEDRPHLDA